MSAHPRRATNDNVLSEENLAALDQGSRQGSRRPMSAYSGRSVRSTRSVVPQISRIKLLTMANDIFRSKQRITDNLLRSGHNARDKKTPSELLHVLRQAGVPITLPTLKGLLQEFGYYTSGVSCSFLELMRKSQAVANGGDRPNAETLRDN
jgi:hypothetical protein